MDILTLILARRIGGGGGGSGLPFGGLPDQILVMGTRTPYWEDPADREDMIGLVAKYDMLPAWTDENGVILVDENMTILLQ